MSKIRIRYLSDKIEKLRYIDGKSDWIDLRAAETVELVEAVSGLPREAIAFVGDRLYTDVACGTKNGARGILVMTGETTPEMLAESSFTPDAVFPSLGAMAPLL